MTRAPFFFSSPLCPLLLGLLFLLWIAPFDEGPARDLFPFTAVVLVAVALAAAYLRRRLAGLTPPCRSRLFAPVLLWFAVAAASVFWSIDPFVSAVGTARVFACAVVFVLVACEFHRPTEQRGICAAVVVLAAALAALGIFQGLAGRGLFPTPGGARAHSVFATPNTFGGFLVLTLPLALGLALGAERRGTRAFFWAASLVLFLGLVLSQSRGAWVAAAFAMALMVGALAWRGRIRLRWRPVLLAVVGVAALGAAALALRPDIRGRVATTLRPGTARSFVERFRYWRSALRMAQTGPLQGIGLDTFHIAYKAYQDPALAGTVQWQAHNDFLQTLVELGPLGLAALLWLLWRAARGADRALRQGASDGRAPLVAGAAAGAAGCVVHSLVDFNLYVTATAVVFFLCLGVLAAAQPRRPSKQTPGGRSTRSRARRAASALVLAGAVVASVYAARPLVGQHLATAALLRQNRAATAPRASSERRRHRATALFYARLAAKVCPWSAMYWGYLASMQEGVAPAAARESYLRAISLSPRSAVFYAHLGRFLRKSAKFFSSPAENANGLDYLRRACALDPWRATWRLWHARALAEDGRMNEAAEELRFCIKRCRPGNRLRAEADGLLAEIRRLKRRSPAKRRSGRGGT